MRRHVGPVSWRVNGPLRRSGHSHEDPNGDSLMAGTQQVVLSEPTTTTLIDDEELRLSLPEATMFIVASSGALWVLLFGLANFLLG